MCCYQLFSFFTPFTHTHTQSVQIKLVLGHSAQWRKRPTPEGFTHDWTVVVRGEDGQEIKHFVEKVVFYLHESFPKPKRGNRIVHNNLSSVSLVLTKLKPFDSIHHCFLPQVFLLVHSIQGPSIPGF